MSKIKIPEAWLVPETYYFQELTGLQAVFRTGSPFYRTLPNEYQEVNVARYLATHLEYFWNFEDDIYWCSTLILSNWDARKHSSKITKEKFEARRESRDLI